MAVIGESGFNYQYFLLSLTKSEGGREVGCSASKTAKPTNSGKTRSKHYKVLISFISFHTRAAYI